MLVMTYTRYIGQHIRIARLCPFLTYFMFGQELSWPCHLQGRLEETFQSYCLNGGWLGSYQVLNLVHLVDKNWFQADFTLLWPTLFLS